MQANTLRSLSVRTHALGEALARFIESAPFFFGSRDSGRMRRAPYLAARVRALECAITLADADDALTIASELTDLEALVDTVLPREAPTVRPPPKSSGTFVIEVRAASTNRLLSGSELRTPDRVG